MKTIPFDQPTHFEARGRNGYLPMRGVVISDMGNGDFAEIHLNPMKRDGNPSEACRIPIRKSALPGLIAELQRFTPEPPLAVYVVLKTVNAVTTVFFDAFTARDRAEKAIEENMAEGSLKRDCYAVYELYLSG